MDDPEVLGNECPEVVKLKTRGSGVPVREDTNKISHIYNDA